jgi:hypothetical protein
LLNTESHANTVVHDLFLDCSSGGQAAQSAAKTAKEGVKRATTNSMMGISLEEAKQILNIERIDKEAITKVSIPGNLFVICSVE